ncbi:MAG: SDR family oxidoreductase [Bacteroidota bacterium]
MNIIVTGAGQGIGFQVVKKLINNSCDIYAISRNAENLAKLKNECENLKKDCSINIIPADIKSPESISFPKGHIDILINNAAVLINRPFEKCSEQEEKEIFETNFFAQARLIRHLLPQMGGEKHTHIVNIGSMGGFQGSSKFNGLSMYSASKAALACLTECLAAEFSNRNIFVNCLALGSVNTEMLRTAFPDYHANTEAEEMAEYIATFALNGYKQYNGKILPVARSTP